MKFVQKISGILVLGAFAAFGVVAVGPTDQTYAAEKNTEKERVYSYTANAGDSYTQLVRKAVQTYGIENKKDIGSARIVAIETKASEQAGWPVLNEGQVVSFNEALIKTWVDGVQGLPESDLAAWQTYVPYIDFNTRNIGE